MNHQVSWDSTDVNGTVVPDGNYQVVIELTDADRPSALGKVSFTKGASPVQLSPADQAHFIDMSLSYR